MRLIRLAIIFQVTSCVFLTGRVMAQTPGPPKAIELAPGGCSAPFELNSKGNRLQNHCDRKCDRGLACRQGRG